MTIYVGNLAFTAKESDLRTVFGEYGTVKRVVVPTDIRTGRARGFAFVELEQVQHEEIAMDQLNGSEWMGRALRLNKAKPKDAVPAARNLTETYGIPLLG
jgi:RNA recognition motif-containing protein